MKRALLCLALLAAFAGRTPAQVCNFTMPNINFGTIDLTAGVNFSTTANFTANCTGLANRAVRVCPNFNAGSGGVNGTGSIRYMLNGANQLQYNIYRSAAFTNVWGSRTWGLPPIPPTINFTLNGAGAGSLNTTVRARVPSGQAGLPVGSYISSFAGAETRVNYAYATAGSCTTIISANLNPTQTPFTVNAIAGGVCTVTATDLDFGTRTLLNANVDAANTISVRCPTGTPYTIGLNGGAAGTSNPAARQMDNTIDTITYGIYRDAARSLGWGDVIGTNTVATTATGAFQNFTAYGRIPPQPTPPADLYADTIVITVTY
jgi:spore coat protein U-like protein